MRSETFRVKKPAWVRIVNPEPIEILDMTWRYGSVALIHPGGVLRTLSERGLRTLAAYQPPTAPSDPLDAPSGAMVLHTHDDLRLLAEGTIGYEEPRDDPMQEYGWGPPIGLVHPGDVGRVPRTRLVRARSTPLDFRPESGGPFRGHPTGGKAFQHFARRTIRPGGTMTVHAVEGAMLRVVYRANPEDSRDQCEDGKWFYVPEAEFLRMDEEYRRIMELEAFERAVVISMLRSF
jgi:hypothetical protein